MLIEYLLWNRHCINAENTKVEKHDCFLYRTYRPVITIQYNICFSVGLHKGLMKHAGDLTSVRKTQ